MKDIQNSQRTLSPEYEKLRHTQTKRIVWKNSNLETSLKRGTRLWIRKWYRNIKVNKFEIILWLPKVSFQLDGTIKFHCYDENVGIGWININEKPYLSTLKAKGKQLKL